MLDLTGTALAKLLAQAGFGPPALPDDPTPDQTNAYNTAVQAQAQVYGIILQYLVDNINVMTAGNANTINDSTSHPCSGTLTSTGTIQ